jgi:hypothetical protein
MTRLLNYLSPLGKWLAGLILLALFIVVAML